MPVSGQELLPAVAAPARLPAAIEPPLAMRPLILAGAAVIGLFFGAFGLWAGVAPLETATIAPGQVIVGGNRKTVQHFEGGIIDQILVSEGAGVEAGQVLIVLDETQPRAAYEMLSGRLRAASALEARLLAERDGRAAIAFPDWLVRLAQDPAVAEAMAGQRRIFEARREAIRNQIGILRQRIAQYREEITGLKAEIAAQNTQLRLAQEEHDGVKELVDKGLERKPRLLRLEREQAEISGALARNQAAIARAQQNIAEAELRIVDIGTTTLNEAVKDLRDAQADIFDLSERLRTAQDVLNRTLVVAPLSGTVVNLRVFTAGGVIAPGEKLMDIVPSEDELLIEARVEPVDIDVVHAGMRARVRLTSFSQRNFTPIEGEVVSISADRVVDERSGQSYYRARVRLTEDPATVLNGASLYPGMPAEVSILLGERTLLGYLSYPLVRTLHRALREG
ncbi:MAG: HlyD family type I secretion periplasmic adaptor subunit [Proteobacteria bacterium]|nr:HlyD family type I secretion periplasmic adaptor subunit [Pseudomonadota bacterium]